MTVPALSNLIKGMLTRSGADNPDGDCTEILMSVLDCDRTRLILYGDREIPDDTAEKAVAMAKRRASGEPIQYVIGSWSFMGRDYKVGEGVLIPRDDTEVVVRAALGLMQGVDRPEIIDLCSGSGIIAITMQKELGGSKVAAIEKSDIAYDHLLQNIGLNDADVQAIKADIADCADAFSDGAFDMIVSNPPYIRSSDIAGLQKEVLYEPRMALDGGESGYDFYEIILQKWTQKLKKGGYIALEIGEDQYAHIESLLQKHGYTDIIGYPDIQGTARAVTARI